MEPLIILIVIGVLLPMLFATDFCANACTESCNNVLGETLAVVIRSSSHVSKVAQALLRPSAASCESRCFRDSNLTKK